MAFKFQWDPNKARMNLQKHGLGFSEASSVFGDPLAGIIFDPDHSDDENRYIILGESQRGRVLVVGFTERGEYVRIISARNATAHERKDYEQRNL